MGDWGKATPESYKEDIKALRNIEPDFTPMPVDSHLRRILIMMGEFVGYYMNSNFFWGPDEHAYMPKFIVPSGGVVTDKGLKIIEGGEPLLPLKHIREYLENAEAKGIKVDFKWSELPNDFVTVNKDVKLIKDIEEATSKIETDNLQPKPVNIPKGAIDNLFSTGRGTPSHKQQKMSELIHTVKAVISLGEKPYIHTPEEKVERLKKILENNNIDLKDVEIIGTGKKLRGYSIGYVVVDEMRNEE